MTDLDDFERRAAEWNARDRAVLDRATWLLLHAAAARLVRADPIAVELQQVAQALRSRPEVVADALRLLDQQDARRAAWREREDAQRLAANIAERQRTHARGLKAYLAHLRADGMWYTPHEQRIMERFDWEARPAATRTFKELVCGDDPPTRDLGRLVLGGRLRWVRRDPARLLGLVTARMCEAKLPGPARAAAALWLRLQGFAGTLEEAIVLLMSEVERTS